MTTSTPAGQAPELPPPPQQVVAVPLFHRMVTGYFAEVEAERAIEKILGLEWDTLGGLGFDYYDNSFEIYAPDECEDIAPTSAQVEAIRALGCDRFWINFKDATERYCGGERKQGHANRWQQWDEGDRTERRRVLAALATQAVSDSTHQAADLSAVQQPRCPVCYAAYPCQHSLTSTTAGWSTTLHQAAKPAKPDEPHYLWSHETLPHRVARVSEAAFAAGDPRWVREYPVEVCGAVASPAGREADHG